MYLNLLVGVIILKTATKLIIIKLVLDKTYLNIIEK